MGALALLAFTRWACHTPTPAIDLTLFQDRTYRVVNLATLSFGMVFAMMFFGFCFFMTKIWHYSLPQAGVAVTPGPLLVIPVAVLSGRWAARHGHRALLVGGSLVYALGGLWFWTMAGPVPDYLHTWLPGLFLTGVGVGMVLPALSGAAGGGGHGRGGHGDAAGARGHRPGRLQVSVRRPHRAGAVDGAAVPAGAHRAEGGLRRRALASYQPAVFRRARSRTSRGVLPVQRRTARWKVLVSA
ncbi:MAG: MFS transporter [Aquabacterium sp.]|uniref:MFS transporter n=1 Tax=Aquabacterium sp. TaxID=1872578 RepID=UPI003BAF878E